MHDPEYLIMRAGWLAEMGVVFSVTLEHINESGSLIKLDGAMELFNELLRKQVNDLQACFDEVTAKKSKPN